MVKLLDCCRDSRYFRKSMLTYLLSNRNCHGGSGTVRFVYCCLDTNIGSIKWCFKL